MTKVSQVEFVKADTLKEKPDSNSLQFGKVFTDYMFEMDYDIEVGGWHNPTIKPYVLLTNVFLNDLQKIEASVPKKILLNQYKPFHK